MAVTRSTVADRTRERQRAVTGSTVSRTTELVCLLAASLLIGAGLWRVYTVKAEPFATLNPTIIHLPSVERVEALYPALPFLPAAPDKQFAARKILDFLRDHGVPPNVGALSRLRVTESEIRRTPRLQAFRARLGQGESTTLFTGEQLRAFKRLVLVRQPGAFRNSVLLWCGLFFVAFYALHLFWRVRGFTGDELVLPILHLLSGLGLILMVSLRDPLRDTMLFASFGQGVVAGCLLMAVASQIDYRRTLGRLSFVPLLASFVLSVLLILFGSGPGASDAKVNLLGFQPVEIIKILLVLFLAGYFARRWELLRELKEKRPELAKISAWVEIPRLQYVLPVLAAVGLALVFFFLQKDLGPALVFTCLFLSLYAVARHRLLLATAGLLLLSAGFFLGYTLKFPRTVFQRVEMWISPWDNAIRGGEQVVHSLWAFATGGLFGMGLGAGEPDLIPAGHTDLILSVLGEELGFAGVLVVFALYALLLYRTLRVVQRAGSDYTFFLALGFAVLIGFQILLIAGGVLDLLPLSGVVTPFLSYGRTAMLANFVIFGILLALSRDTGEPERNTPFAVPVRWLTMIIGAGLLAVTAKAAWVQVIRDEVTLGAGALTVQADGARRFQYNPRLLMVARSIPRGSIYDRNGIPLATSRWEELEKFRQTFQQIGINIDQAVERNDSRLYPLGGAAFHLLGDLRTRENWAASNTSYQERDSAVRLQGYDDRARVVEVKNFRDGKPGYAVRYDYRELVPLLRNWHDKTHPDVRRVLERERDVQMSIDARLQWRAVQILAAHLKKLGRERGALVMMDPRSGDLLASVSQGDVLDRARYGLYPPGSTFKIVTATAALRENPAHFGQTYACVRLPDGRVGNSVRGWGRPVRDDIADTVPHGNLAMDRAIVVSCNAYFAQLGTYTVGAERLLETATLFGISAATPATAKEVRGSLPQASYGQGEVVASPFQMARVAATMAAGGRMPYGRWVMDNTNPRVQEPQAVLAPNLAQMIAQSMRGVVTNGTGRAVAGNPVPIAGKTGTAELERAASHAWFVGFAPYGGDPRIAFAVIVENGRYGGSAAAPIAGDAVTAAQQLGILTGRTAP